MKTPVPQEVVAVSKALAEAGFEAYLVGGCVRDMLLGREPKDWDIATSALPQDVLRLFPDSVYENDFGTVGVKTDSEDPKVKVIEVTTYRVESGYTDKRHPDNVSFAKTIEEDLARRDFTVNAMAMNLKGEIIDPFGGKKDLEAKVIRTVGKPEERFAEDALRLMRAVRFSVQLDTGVVKDLESAPPGWQIEDRDLRRILTAGDEVVTEISYTSMPPWSGSVKLENHRLHYTLTVQTAQPQSQPQPQPQPEPQASPPATAEG